MRYDTYTPHQMAGLRTRIQNSLQLLNDWNRDVVGSSPPEAVTGGRELTAWQTASNWQASARDPVTPQIAMGVDSVLANPPQWASNQPQQSGWRKSHSSEQSPVRIMGRPLGRNSTPPSREPSRQPTPFIPPPPSDDVDSEDEPYMNGVQDHTIVPNRRSHSRSRQNHVPAWRNNGQRERSTQLEQQHPGGFLFGPIDRALQEIIDRGEITGHPGVLNIVPDPSASPHSPTSAHFARSRKEMQRATERNRARGAKHRQDYAHSDTDSDSSDDNDSDNDWDKENRRGRAMDRGRRSRVPHNIYAPPTPHPNMSGQSLQHNETQGTAPTGLKWYEVPARIGPGPPPAPRPPPRPPTASPEPEFNRSRSKWGTERRRPQPLDSHSVNVPAAAVYQPPALVIPDAMTRPAPVVQQAHAAPVVPDFTPVRNQDAPRRRRRTPAEQPWERAVAPPESLTDPAQLAQYQFEQQRRRFEEEKEVKRQLSEREKQFYQAPPTPDVRSMTQEEQAQYWQQQHQLQQLEQQQQHARQTLHRQHYQQQPGYHPPGIPSHGPPPPWLQQPQQYNGHLFR